MFLITTHILSLLEYVHIYVSSLPTSHLADSHIIICHILNSFVV